jgi:hypothetical protein
MSKRNPVIACLALVFALFASPAFSATNDQQDAIEDLLHHFVEAFNSGDFEAMAAFYDGGASASFNERRTEQEDRALHQQLTSMLGKITVEKLEVQSVEKARLIVVASSLGEKTEIRFGLVAEPPLIDGFSIGINPNDNPNDNPDGQSAGAGSVAEHSTPGDSSENGPFGFLTAAEGVHQSQVFTQADGSLLLVWAQKGLYSLDLFVARQEQQGEFSHPVRINHHALNRYVGDEARPSVAIGSDGGVAVAWTAANSDIMLAVGSDYGQVFDPPVKLNQDQERAERTMPSVALSADGAAHAIWLDARGAPKGMEEPSNLYYAMVKNGVVEESNLTVNQQTSVCGCCRPFIAIDGKGQCDIAFRNVSEDGYRDISRISGTIGSLGEPQSTSPPIWKLGGCPSAGPIVNQGGTLWKDASTGDWRMLWATNAKSDPAVLFTDREGLDLTAPPRTVSGKPDWVLVGAKPNGLIATLDKGSWQVLRDDIPAWVTSAAARDGELILIGNQRGRLLTATMPL